MKNKCDMCGKKIGTGCGCCADDFPEYLGYCNECYPSSKVYEDNMQILKSLLDGINNSMKERLIAFIDDYDEEHCQLYKKEIRDSIDEEA